MGRDTGRNTGRGQIGRWLAVGARALAWGTTALGIAVGIALGPAPAFAADPADQVTVTGVDLPEQLTVVAEQQPDLCAALHREVDWLVGRSGDAPEPDPELLGPQYTLEVHVDGEAAHRFHLYPLAEGGPRVFRPEEQPGDRTVKEAWFFGRLSLPETLGAAGVPLTGGPVAPGGTGGGEPAPAETAPPESSALGFIEEWREGMLLTSAVVVGIALGLGGIAFLIRRKV